jgi:hypothetical protein
MGHKQPPHQWDKIGQGTISTTSGSHHVLSLYQCSMVFQVAHSYLHLVRAIADQNIPYTYHS